MSFHKLSLLGVAVAVVLCAGAARAEFMSDTFDGDTLDPAKWTSPIPVTLSGGQAVFNNRDYLVSVPAFEPSAAMPVTISGTLTWSSAQDNFKIVTRSACEPNYDNYTEVKYGLCAHLRQNASNTQIDIRYFNGGTVINGSGFVDLPETLEVGNQYDFTIVDDGANMTFTVTEVGNSTNTATVSYANTIKWDTFKVGFYNRNNVAYTLKLDEVTISQVPEPSAMMMVLTALGGLVAYAWRKRR